MKFMPKCIKCNYELVLLSSRPKYKCAVCSRLYPKKEIENKEFRTWNEWQRGLDVKDYELKIKEELKALKGLRKEIRLLFDGLPFDSKEFYERNKDVFKQKNKEWRLKNRTYDLKRKRKYYKKNKEVLNLKTKQWRKKNLDAYNKQQREWRANNLDQVRLNGQIQFWRRKQKGLALGLFENIRELGLNSLFI